jgi:PAS domain S-box-containing protein
VNRLDGVFREADLEFFQHLANQVGVALESCRLFEETSELLAYTNSVINSLTGGFISTDPQGIVTRCNHSASHILATASDEVVGQPLLSALPHYPAFSAILDVTLKHQTPVARQEIELQRPDGAAMLIGYSTFLIHNDAKRLLGAGIIFQDLTHLKRN